MFRHALVVTAYKMLENLDVPLHSTARYRELVLQKTREARGAAPVYPSLHSEIHCKWQDFVYSIVAQTKSSIIFYPVRNDACYLLFLRLFFCGDRIIYWHKQREWIVKIAAVRNIMSAGYLLTEDCGDAIIRRRFVFFLSFSFTFYFFPSLLFLSLLYFLSLFFLLYLFCSYSPSICSLCQSFYFIFFFFYFPSSFNTYTYT
jgi:hypothetical protein